MTVEEIKIFIDKNLPDNQKIRMVILRQVLKEITDSTSGVTMPEVDGEYGIKIYTTPQMMLFDPDSKKENLKLVVLNGTTDPRLKFPTDEIYRQAVYKYMGGTTNTLADYLVISAPYAGINPTLQEVITASPPTDFGADGQALISRDGTAEWEDLPEPTPLQNLDEVLNEGNESELPVVIKDSTTETRISKSSVKIEEDIEFAKLERDNLVFNVLAGGFRNRPVRFSRTGFEGRGSILRLPDWISNPSAYNIPGNPTWDETIASQEWVESRPIIEEKVEGTREDWTGDGIKELDWKEFKVFRLTLTGDTELGDVNIPTLAETKVIELIVTGEFQLDFPAYWTVTSASDTYDGTKLNHILVSCIDGTSGSEMVIVSISQI